MSVLLRAIREISPDAAAVLGRAGFVSDTDIQSLNRQDLNELFPEKARLRLRKNISDLIQLNCPPSARAPIGQSHDACPQPEHPPIDHHSRRQSGANSHKPINAVLKELLDFILDDRVKAALTNNGALSDYLFILRDMKTKVENLHAFLEAHIDLFEEYTKKQEKARPASSSADLEPSFAPVESQVYGRTDDHDQAQRTVRIQTIVRGKTFDCHRTVLQRVRQVGGLQVEETTSGKVIVVFCPVSSRNMTDIAAAMKDVPGGSPVILVVMHHTHDGDYPHTTRSLGSDHSWNVEDFVNVLYHETVPGLLTCPLNEQAVAQLHSALLKHSSVSPTAASLYSGSSSVSPTAASAYGGSSTGKTKGGGGGVSAGISGSEPRCAPVERHFNGRTDDHGQAQHTVRIQTMVRGQTFDCHHTLLQRVRQVGGLHLEETTSGKVIVVFCPVSSRHMTDIEAAMKDVPGGSPVILVVMHHTRDSDYPNITRSLGSDHNSWNVEDFVNVLYHETPGLLTCPLNEQAVAQLHSALLKHSSVGPTAASLYSGISSVGPTAASVRVNGGGSSGVSTASVSAYSGSSTGKNKGGGGGLFAGTSVSEPTCAPVERQVCGQTDDHGQAQRTVRIQTMVRGQTFDCHRTVLQRVRQVGGLHVEETTSGKVIVVFCPNSSRHMTDIEAAMKDVPGGRPVILVVMHHTRDSDYPNITRSLGSDHNSWNVEDFVNVLYHEMPGLLTCPLNEQAVAQLHSALLKHSSVSPASASVYAGSRFVSPTAASMYSASSGVSRTAASVHGGTSGLSHTVASASMYSASSGVSRTAASVHGGSSTGKTKGGGGGSGNVGKR